MPLGKLAMQWWWCVSRGYISLSLQWQCSRPKKLHQLNNVQNEAMFRLENYHNHILFHFATCLRISKKQLDLDNRNIDIHLLLLNNISSHLISNHCWTRYWWGCKYQQKKIWGEGKGLQPSELNVDNWNDNCEAKSEAKSPRPLRGLQVDFSLTRNVSYAVR